MKIITTRGATSKFLVIVPIDPLGTATIVRSLNINIFLICIFFIKNRLEMLLCERVTVVVILQMGEKRTGQ
jgi:hypothetical protein